MNVRLTAAVSGCIFEITRILGKSEKLHEGMLLEIMDNLSGYVVAKDIASDRMLLLPDCEIGGCYGTHHKLCEDCGGRGDFGSEDDCSECAGNGFLWL